MRFAPQVRNTLQRIFKVYQTGNNIENFNPFSIKSSIMRMNILRNFFWLSYFGSELDSASKLLIDEDVGSESNDCSGAADEIFNLKGLDYLLKYCINFDVYKNI